jgi:hypothetical protein
MSNEYVHRALAAEQNLGLARVRIRELEVSIEKYQACRVHDVDEKAWLSKRVTELEAELALVKAERDRFLYVKNLASQSDAGADLAR